MKILGKRAVFAVLCLWLLSFPVEAARELVPVGQVIGLELRSGTVTVAGFDPQLGEAAKKAGLQEGDCIEKVNGKAVRCAEDVRAAVMAAHHQPLELTVSRGGKRLSVTVRSSATEQGPKLGIYLRQGITGIGTVTWYDPETGSFGALGHGVNRPDGKLLQMTRGYAYSAKVAAVRKGISGQPGQLVGQVEDRSPLGELMCNTGRGVFGKTEAGWQGKALPIGEGSQIRTGEATILSTVKDSTVREYSVEILKIYPKANQTGRNLLLKVTDPALLEATGGIVQGMSGSPILQDGKIIGAVTHVLVNQPDTGYGIFIENMQDAAS